MSEEEFKEFQALDAWIGEHVMGVKPTTESVAMDTEEKGIALWSDNPSDRETIREFCEKHPQYHYVERKLYPAYSTNGAAAIAVLEKCAEKYTLSILKEEGKWRVLTWDELIKGELTDSLPMAICLFTKQLFAVEAASK